MKKYRNDFSVYRNNPELVYLDYAATTFMPDVVINTWLAYQTSTAVAYNRGNGLLAERAIIQMEKAKKTLLSFFNASDNYDIAFGKNATECLNLLAFGLQCRLSPGDIILMSPFEHHSNLLPWKEVAQNTGACLLQLPMREDGRIDYGFLEKIDLNLIKVISVSLVSNVNCYQFEVEYLRRIINVCNPFVIIDVCQAVGHQVLSFSDFPAHAYVMSAHKMYGPKNIGAAFIKKEEMERICPFIYGGGMVWDSLGDFPVWYKDWKRFTAGTFDVGLISAWSAACQYIKSIGMNEIAYSNSIMYKHFVDHIKQYGARIIPGGGNSCSLCSFYLPGFHAHDIAALAAKYKIEVRCGHLCAQDMLNLLGVTSLCRVSWGIGSQIADVDAFIKILEKR